MSRSLLNPDAPDAAIAVIDAASGERLTYGDLRAIEAGAAPRRGLAFLLARNRLGTVRALIEAWASDQVVAPINPDLKPEALIELAGRYRPDVLLGDAEDIAHVGTAGGGGAEIHPDLHLLLATSGTTGGPKFVRLSRQAVASNARDIVTALSILPQDRALAHLPLHYSFGLSVLTSHLAAGASVMLSEDGLTSGSLWNAAREHGCTSISLVPAHAEMLRRLSLARLKVETLKIICQAGGRADPVTLKALHEQVEARGGRLHVMYGQTEAAPRMTTLPAEDFVIAPNSVGPALASGRLSILGPDGEEQPTGETGEVRYQGPNVMMGYALSADDLILGDEAGGVLMTGDLGRLDEAGRLYLSGRTARFAKVAGLRLGLDEVERLAESVARAAALDGGDRVIVAVEGVEDDERRKAVRDHLQASTSAPLGSFDVRFVAALPLKANGKIDYQALAEQLA